MSTETRIEVMEVEFGGEGGLVAWGIHVMVHLYEADVVNVGRVPTASTSG